MKKSGFCSLLCGLMIVFLAGCDTIKDYSKEELVITVPHVIYFGNLAEVIIVPEKNGCRIVHEHFNRKHGHGFKVPYSIATIYFADKKFIISDKASTFIENLDAITPIKVKIGKIDNTKKKAKFPGKYDILGVLIISYKFLK